MGRLVEQSLTTLFHGVSRQPDPLRLPGQMEECVNNVLSVDRGGFEKRFGSEHVTEIAASSDPAQLHVIDRDENEKYLVVAQAGTLKVFDDDGVEKTVDVTASASLYMAGDAERDLVFITIADHTLILNRRMTAAMAAETVPAPVPMAIVSIQGARQGQFGIWLDGVMCMNNAATASPTAAVIAGEIAADIAAKAPGVYAVTRDNAYLFIHRVDGGNFGVAPIEDYPGYVKVYKDRVGSTAELPPRAPAGAVFRVEGTLGIGYTVKFEVTTGSYEGIWMETVKPGSKHKFDPATMPHTLVRNADGTFTVKPVEWNEKKAGDDESVPTPDFVGRTISDIVFYRNRMAVIADETVFFSQAGDLFNFWPNKTTQVDDSDPFGLTAQSGRVSLLRYAVPFRNTLFLTADASQFEVNADVLTPKSTAISPTTAYKHTPRCRPEVCGNGLYMVAEDGDNSAVMLYQQDRETLANEAVDISRHCRGYVPGAARQLVGEPVTGNLYLLSDKDRSGVWAYTFFWQGDELAQSAWHRWSFGGGTVLSIGILSGQLYMLVRRPMRTGTKTFIERVPISRPQTGDFAYLVRLDRRAMVQGTYNATSKRTTWVLPYGDATGVQVEPVASLNVYDRPLLSQLGDSVVTAEGDWSTKPLLFGFEFESRVTLSKLYLRENNAPIVTGRTQVRSVTFYFEDTGLFEVDVTLPQRPTVTKQFSGKVLGSAVFRIGQVPLEKGVFRVWVWGENRYATITLRNSSRTPHLVTSAAWSAFFNEVSRQG